MSALGLVLVAALCTVDGDKICTYMDITERMQVTTDKECYDMAIYANLHNTETGQEPRFDCVEPAQYLKLLGEKPKAEAAKPGRVL